MPNNAPIKTSLGFLSGRDCIYLDSVSFNDMTTLVLAGSINGNLCSIRKPGGFIPFTLHFKGVLALTMTELDSSNWLEAGESCFEEIRNSEWVCSLGGKVTPAHRHFYVQTYDHVFEIVCEKYEFQTK